MVDLTANLFVFKKRIREIWEKGEIGGKVFIRLCLETDTWYIVVILLFTMQALRIQSRDSFKLV